MAQSPANQSLRQQLFVCAAVALICTGFLAATIIARAYSDYVLTRSNLRAVSDYRDILDAANILSAERGPANSLLGASVTARALRERLDQFRARSDEALKDLSERFSHDKEGLSPSLLTPVIDQLEKARRNIDTLTAVPRDSRSVVEVQDSIEDMIEVINLFQPVIFAKMHAIVAANPNIGMQVMMCYIFAELREYGGRTGSYIMAPIALHQPQPTHNLIISRQSQGRLLELWNLAQMQRGLVAQNPELAADMEQVRTLFFGEGFLLLDQLIAQGRYSGNYSMSAEEFTNKLVHTLQPLEWVRRDYFNMTIEQLSRDQTEALQILIGTSITTTVILAFLVALILNVQRAVFRPLLLLRDRIIELAEDRQTAAPAPFLSRDVPEMHNVFEAIEALRDSMFQKASVTEELKTLSETDGLTGIFNRRTLDSIGEARDPASAGSACLILIDIDHFKAINDTHGHLIGDMVLKTTVQLIRTLLRSEDIFARFGGEEFAILAMDAHLPHIEKLAERIRVAVSTLDILIDDNKSLNITASFGVAYGNLGGAEWSMLIASADAALYRAKTEGRNRVRSAETPSPALSPDEPDNTITPRKSVRA